MFKYIAFFSILFVVSCADENESSSSSHSTQTTHPPTIQVSQPETISGYQTVTLDASATTTDPDGTIASYFWQPQESAIIATNGVMNS